MLSDLKIANSAKIKPIEEIAQKLGIKSEDLELYGKYKAKLSLKLIDEAKVLNSHLVLVTAISPTPTGEGKTTVSIGLVDGLNKIGLKAVGALREPSLGPVFGMKGGAAGGGYSQVIPMEDINLHFTGDFSAIEKANNLLAAMIDNNIQSKVGNLGIDPRTVVFKRVMDINDRSLRDIVTGLGRIAGGVVRETGFNITAASEVMAIVCLAKNLSDLKRRLSNIYVGSTYEGKAVFAKDLKAENSMTVLLKDAIKPNLVQTLENNPVIIHGGPFANIAQGTNSVIATKMAMSFADIVVTEAGFGADLGAEKFLDIKCTLSSLKPKVVVIVATVKALKYHGGVEVASIKEENIEALRQGFKNLERHIENMHKFGLDVVVAINHFDSDFDSEIDLLKLLLNKNEISFALSKGFKEGGEGCKKLAKVVHEVIEKEKKSLFKPLYNEEMSLKEKIETIAKEIYRATGIVYSTKALSDLKKIESLKIEDLKICMAKTQYSFSEDPNLRNAPDGHILNIKEIEMAIGAGFIVPIVGTMLRMPGLPNIPQAVNITIDDEGIIEGLS
jgi:formate--tetrahydrofolate ligase